jgi:hypothetical protein
MQILENIIIGNLYILPLIPHNREKNTMIVFIVLSYIILSYIITGIKACSNKVAPEPQIMAVSTFKTAIILYLVHMCVPI